MKRNVFRSISAVTLTVAVLFTTVFSISFFASAATFTPRLTAPASTNKYYYNSDYNVFQKYGYGLPNCTAYAYGRAYEILGKEPKLSWNGAGQWYGYNKSNGYYKYGSTPKVGAIACWCYSGGGHVAVVEKIDSSGNMTLSNSEWGGRTFYLTTAKTSDKNPGGNSWWTFQGYIYLIDSATTTTTSYKPGKYLTEATLNLRSGAGLSYSVLKTVATNLTLTIPQVVEKDGYHWGYATVFGTKGWVALEYCKYLSALPTTTAAPATTKPPTTTKPAATVAPTTKAPTTTVPATTKAPTTTVPATTKAPTTTVPPTTKAPTTTVPATTVPATTVAQTTAAPVTTVAPTTVEPTTVEPTTAEPVTAAPKMRGIATLEYKPGSIGDVNGDGRITIQDGTIIQKYLAGVLGLNETQQSWCDFDFSGRISIDDVTCLQRYLACMV